MSKIRKGFTLVELLIVIVVIGILSAMMMMSSTEAVTTATASNITSNLRNLKTAALAFYTDHIGSADTDFTGNAQQKAAIFSYLNSDKDIPDYDKYTFPTKDGKWYVMYEIPTNMSSKNKVMEKLKGRAGSMGFLNESYSEYTGGAKVVLRVR